MGLALKFILILGYVGMCGGGLAVYFYGTVGAKSASGFLQIVVTGQ
jgi:hypothetical protein